MNMLKKIALRRAWRAALIAGLSPIALGWLGCAHDRVAVTPPRPIGTFNDEAFRTQEENAEAWKYVVYMHEFELNEAALEGDNPGGWKLNEAGEDHLRQIAVNIKRGDHYPIVVERSDTSSKPGTEYGYPVHFNDELDARRRQVVVAALSSLGIPDADQRVVVAPCSAEGIEATFRPHLTLARHAQDSRLPAEFEPIRWPVWGYALLHSRSGPPLRYELLERVGA